MSHLLNVIIEPLEGRYSIDWDLWFQEQFTKHGISSTIITGRETSGKITHGSFLDVLETNQYKVDQTLRILDVLKDYDGKEELIIFFQDLWHTALPALAYIRDGMKWKNLKIVGCLHAGSYDKFDFLNRVGMTKWAEDLENSWFHGIVDQIYVATSFHKEMLCRRRNVYREKVFITGFPIFSNIYTGPKEKIVVFPHRLDPEKQPELFEQLEKEVKKSSIAKDWKFIRTKDIAGNKEEFYDVLAYSRIAVSFAQQETWGIAMQEAIFYGCVPLCPNRLSYTEMYGKDFLYETFEELVEKTLTYMAYYPKLLMQQQQEYLLNSGKNAIPNMLKIMKQL